MRLQFLADLLEHCAREIRPSHILGFYAGSWSYSACLAAQALGCPHSVFCRGNDVDLDIFGEQAFQLDFQFRRSRDVFCVSNEMTRKVKAFAPGANAIWIPNGVDSTEFPLLPTKAAGGVPVIGIFGEVKEKKGLGLLLSSLPLADMKLRIVGSLRPETQKLLQGHFALHPQDVPQIEIVPYVKSSAELLEQYAQVDIVCLPSTHEGMSNVMLEAMSCGKIVLASAVGGALDVLRDRENGFLFNPRDPASFAQALHAAVAALSDGANEIGKVARETVSNDFSWHREQLAYVEAFASTSS